MICCENVTSVRGAIAVLTQLQQLPLLPYALVQFESVSVVSSRCSSSTLPDNGNQEIDSAGDGKQKREREKKSVQAQTERKTHLKILLHFHKLIIYNVEQCVRVRVYVRLRTSMLRRSHYFICPLGNHLSGAFCCCCSFLLCHLLSRANATVTAATVASKRLLSIACVYRSTHL